MDEINFTISGLTNEQCVGYYYSKFERAIGIQKARDISLKKKTLGAEVTGCPEWVIEKAIELFNQNHQYAQITGKSIGSIPRFLTYTVLYKDAESIELDDFLSSFDIRNGV